MQHYEKQLCIVWLWYIWLVERLLSHIFHKQVKRIGVYSICIWRNIRLRKNHDFWLIHFTQQLYTCWINLQFPHMHQLMSFVTFRHMHVTRHMIIMWVTCILYLNFKSGGNITGWLILPKYGLVPLLYQDGVVNQVSVWYRMWYQTTTWCLGQLFQMLLTSRLCTFLFYFQ